MLCNSVRKEECNNMKIRGGVGKIDRGGHNGLCLARVEIPNRFICVADNLNDAIKEKIEIFERCSCVVFTYTKCVMLNV